MNLSEAQVVHRNKCSFHPNIPDKFYLFPFVKKGVEKKTTLALDGLAVEEGWYSCLSVAFGAIWSHVSKHPELRETFYITQVKEKFGTLRIYTHGSDEKINSIIRWVESASKKLCEFCGSHGAQKRPFCWVKTMCRRCMWSSIWQDNRPVGFRLFLLWNWVTGR